MLPDVEGAEELWIPLVDEPIGAIVERVQEERPEIAALVNAPRKLLAFRTFAYIRVGILLGRLLVETDSPAEDGGWVEQLVWQAATFRDGKLTWWASFRSEAEALAALELR